MDPVTATAPSEAVEQELGGPEALKILEEAPDGLVLVDGSRRVRFANAVARRAATPDRCVTPLSEPFELAFPHLNPPRGASDNAGGCDEAVHWRADPAGGWTGWFARPHRSVAARSVDDLTGLGDRKALREALRLLTAGGEPQTTKSVVLCLDLDHFKSINDTLGHAVGDAVLRKAAQRLERCVRRSDALFRVGGDEFVVLLTEPDAEESASGIAKRIVEILGRPYLAEGHQATVGVSVGIALSDPNDFSPEDALRRADMALYESKRAGRRRATWFRPSMAIELEQRRILEAELRCALLLKQFELHYQPQMNASTGEVVGFEALVRWRHPERGLVSPAAFIPVAEETGMIEELGRWVLLEACRTAAGWPDHISIAVNVSAIQFAEAGFDQVVFAALEASGLPGARLELEVTESVLIKDEDLLLACMQKLRARGVRLSLDDFGTGYSSLSYLERIPFDKVKIDQSFVRANADDRAVVATIAALGQAKGMEVLAEGVETSDQLDSVVEVGCRSVQGFLFSRPLPAAEATAYLDAASARALKKG